MPRALITGSSGLVGSGAVTYFDRPGRTVVGVPGWDLTISVDETIRSMVLDDAASIER